MIPRHSTDLAYAQSKAIISRFLKEGAYKGNSKREHSMMRRFYSQYPDLSFWSNWTLGFQLNSLLWFNGADGRKALEDGWRMFHFNMDKLPGRNGGNDAVSGTDNLDTSSLDNLFGVCHSDKEEDKLSEDILASIPKKPKNIIDFLSD